MGDDRVGSSRSWAQPQSASTDPSTAILFWKRACMVLSVLVLGGVGAMMATVSASMQTTQALSKNLELKQRVREIEGSLADVDHIMVQLRLVDAQIQTMVQDNPKVENTEP